VSRIVVLGDLMVDVVVRLSGPLAQASDAPAEIRFRGGGSAANTAAWLAAAGADVTLVSRAGADERGRAAVEELRAAGVDADVALDEDRPTGTCLVLIEPGGERTMAPDAGANDWLTAEDLSDDLLAEAAHLHVAGYALLRDGSRAAARGAIERALKAGIGVSVDPSSSALLDASFLDLADGAGLLLPNASEAHALSGDSDPEAAARALAERFGEVVVTLGPGGALWTDGAEVLRAAAVAVDEVEDTAGAGDAFAAGFLDARVSGASTAESLAAGCKLAARAVTIAGARP
jgi:sugar/nucleoside kinase (ribokinase family)